MPRTRRSALRSPVRTARVHMDVESTLTPETGFKVSLTQMFGIGAGIFCLAICYAYLVYGTQSTRSDVTDIKAAQVTAIAQTQVAIKEQDERRTQLGKQFLESNEKIAAAVGTLATQMAVQQERQKATDEKLEKVLTQIGMALAPATIPPLPPLRR